LSITSRSPLHHQHIKSRPIKKFNAVVAPVVVDVVVVVVIVAAAVAAAAGAVTCDTKIERLRRRTVEGTIG